VSFSQIFQKNVYGEKFEMKSNNEISEFKSVQSSDNWDVCKCVIHYSELSLNTNEKMTDIAKQGTEKVCIKVYRNGVSSAKSVIPLHARRLNSKGKSEVCGFRPTDGPCIRGELACDAGFDNIIMPGSNKSNIVVEQLLVNQLQMLANYLRTKKFIKSRYQTRKIEGDNYHLHNDKICITKDSDSIGKHGGKNSSKPKWEYMPKYPKNEKEDKLNLQNNTSPFTKEYIDNSDCVKWQGAVQGDFEFCLLLIDPTNVDSESIVVSKTEYEMIEKGTINKKDLFDNEKSKAYLQKEINKLLERVSNTSNMRVVDKNAENTVHEIGIVIH
jgi:hypothetical protein